MIRDDRDPKNTSRSLKVSGGKENLLRGNILANGLAADKSAATIEANHE